MEAILELLEKAMRNARMLAVLQFDPSLFLFTSALESVIRQGRNHLKSKKKKAYLEKAFVDKALVLLGSYEDYLRQRRGFSSLLSGQRAGYPEVW
jgi:hypothetical protein